MSLDTFNKTRFTDQIKLEGVVQVDGLIPLSLIDALRRQVLECVHIESDRQGTKEYSDFGRILFAPVYGGAFLDILDTEMPFNLARELLKNEIIIYTMTSSCIPPNGTNYTNQIHRDSEIRLPGCSLAMQILLDNFTETNGAPLFLKGSHNLDTKPTNSVFEKNATLITGKKGDVTFFDPRIWHRSTTNRSDSWRSCLLIAFIQPWMKQRFNVEAMLSKTDLSSCSAPALQLLGLDSLPPKSWDDYYRNGQSVFR